MNTLTSKVALAKKLKVIPAYMVQNWRRNNHTYKTDPWLEYNNASMWVQTFYRERVCFVTKLAIWSLLFYSITIRVWQTIIGNIPLLVLWILISTMTITAIVGSYIVKPIRRLNAWNQFAIDTQRFLRCFRFEHDTELPSRDSVHRIVHRMLIQSAKEILTLKENPEGFSLEIHQHLVKTAKQKFKDQFEVASLFGLTFATTALTFFREAKRSKLTYC